MSVSRRSFFHTVGAGSALLSADFLIGRGREAMAFEAVAVQPPDDGGFLRIDSNENARGPGRSTIEALKNGISARVGRGYPPDYVGDLYATIASTWAVDRNHVLAATGSGPILEAMTRAFCAMDKPLVTAAPTFTNCEQTARRMGVPVKIVPVDKSLSLDVAGMAEAARGAGLVFFCNPNNPTGTAHGAATVEKFVRDLARVSPGTKVLVDEAYIDYAHDPAVKTAIPLAKELPSVVVTRTYSKAHGMAGLRLGYAVGQADTLRAVSQAWGLGSLNTLSATAGIASLRDVKHMDEERAENARVRDFTLQAFRDMGFEGTDANTNCVFIDIKRPAKDFRDACAAQKVRVGRDFPPYEKSHTRISLGTMDEMRQAVAVFRQVLTASTASRAGQR
ncbi:MAG: aminotransferase class I/II-fold pyridoxal phosphate-dependent enzyme [Vicinamibacterales bacterium]